MKEKQIWEARLVTYGRGKSSITKWHIIADHKIIAKFEKRAYAELAAKTHNLHEELLEALRKIEEAANEVIQNEKEFELDTGRILNILKPVIAKAEETGK